MAKATLIRDGALKIERCNQQGGSFPHICNNDKCQRSGRYRMSIVGWPAGDYCEKCMKGMTAAWDGALSSRGVTDSNPAACPSARERVSGETNLGRESADREAAGVPTDAASSRLKAAA